MIPPDPDTRTRLRRALDRVDSRAVFLRCFGLSAILYGLAYTPWLEPARIPWPVDQLQRLVPFGLDLLAGMWIAAGLAAVVCSFLRHRWPPFDLYAGCWVSGMYTMWGMTYVASFVYYLAATGECAGSCAGDRDWFTGGLLTAVGVGIGAGVLMSARKQLLLEGRARDRVIIAELIRQRADAWAEKPE